MRMSPCHPEWLGAWFPGKATVVWTISTLDINTNLDLLRRDGLQASRLVRQRRFAKEPELLAKIK